MLSSTASKWLIKPKRNIDSPRLYNYYGVSLRNEVKTFIRAINFAASLKIVQASVQAISVYTQDERLYLLLHPKHCYLQPRRRHRHPTLHLRKKKRCGSSIQRPSYPNTDIACRTSFVTLHW